MRFSIITPSLLADYPNAANNREGKLLRAVNSVLSQTFEDWELLIIADGCQKTIDIIRDNVGDDRVKTYLIPRSRLWSGEPRNKGIKEAQGDFIVYLDIDDIIGVNHLANIDKGLRDFNWVWFDDIRYSVRSGQWYDNPCNISKLGQHGTSNICHKTNMRVKWDHDGYAHDYWFVAQLRQDRNYAKIGGAEYYVCHIPGKNGGYDL